MSDISHLKESVKNLNLLYIEETSEFRKLVSDSLGDLFESMFVAVGVKEGLDTFKNAHSQIVIIDVENSNFAWVEIAKHINDVKPETKVIILSKFNDIKSLHTAIDVGVMKYLVKPIEVDIFLDTIELAIHKLKIVEDEKLFYTSLNNIHNCEESMVMMLEDKKPIVANQLFLDFFATENIEEFNTKHKNIGDLFLKHDRFLYNHDNLNWLDNIDSHNDKLFHVRMKNLKNEMRHFLLKYHNNQKKQSYTVVSFHDVTNLDFAELFNESHLIDTTKLQDKKSLFCLLQLIQKNNIKIHLYNYYKGLTIINNATITEVKDDTITLKTNYIQQKAIHYENKTLIFSEVLPSTVACDIIIRNTFEKQSVKVKNIHYNHTSAVKRKTIRLLPDEKYTISLFLENKTGRYKNRIVIEDISLDSVRLRFRRTPTDIKENDNVIIDIVFDVQNKPLIINTNAMVFKKDGNKIIFLLNLNETQKNNMLKYMTSRQVDIIKEFRVLQK